MSKFKKSSFSGDGRGNGDGCVEVKIDGASIYVRDTKSPSKATLVFNRKEWRAFIKGVKAGEFDLS